MDQTCTTTNCAITPVQVRDEIVSCFVKAHSANLEEMKEFGEIKSEEEFERLKKLNVEELVKSFFSDTGGNYENPTKSDLQKVIDKLAEYAANFRSQDVVKQNYMGIKAMIDRLN